MNNITVIKFIGSQVNPDKYLQRPINKCRIYRIQLLFLWHFNAVYFNHSISKEVGTFLLKWSKGVEQLHSLTFLRVFHSRATDWTSRASCSTVMLVVVAPPSLGDTSALCAPFCEAPSGTSSYIRDFVSLELQQPSCTLTFLTRDSFSYRSLLSITKSSIFSSTTLVTFEELILEIESLFLTPFSSSFSFRNVILCKNNLISVYYKNICKFGWVFFL